MKKFPLSSVLLGAFVGVMIPAAFTSPVAYGAEHDHAQHQSQASKTYTCPMHPEVISDKEGTCPICNMFLVVKEEEEESTVDGTQDPMANMQSATPVKQSQADKVFSQPKPTLVPTANQSDSTNVKYVCPMHPHVVSDAPGTCPICGMNLEKVTVTDASQEIVVGVSGGMQQALGMRSHVVEKTSLSRQVNTIGTVQYNENAIGHVHTRATGWIETLTVHNVGQQIKKGQLLYELYSPELVNAQDDYSQAQDYLLQDKKRGSSLLLKARKRLELLGVDTSIIDRLEKTGETIFKVPFYAPQDGFISKLTVRDGMYIQPGDTLFEIVNLDSVWVIADVFENEQSWLQQGRKVSVSAAAQGLFDIDSTIDYIYPELDPVTRAMRVRIKLNNHNDKLRPGSLVDVTLFGLPKNNVLTVPTEALILTGRENRVVVQRSDTSFASVPVKIGMMADGRAEILEGLNEHDKVVISGQFLLDSEASIQGSLQRLSNAPTTKESTTTDAHQH
ncbi:efflux RND transporter periplasmic adaptor subunit [Shewanella sp. BF02_Schw]|uniref:efflux RND transporter periplasmic adaptor subunit n=1 Tax=unclassified Shewanella TaxID=196818 RepID=UPI0017841F1E|nr:efflux RND transporter periplasmic adaptor subunit [Shewanella sp. BF02_Schw]MBO1897187.1 efflux RND transporter periplasmic adaptor subunit [Shewanella sp. BF02_Schw]